MAVNFSRIQNVIKTKAIAPLGDTIVVIEPDPTDLVAASPQRGPGTNTTRHTVSAVEVKSVQKDNKREIEYVLPGDVTFQPKQGWLVEAMDGLTYTIVSAEDTKPSLTSLAKVIKVQR